KIPMPCPSQQLAATTQELIESIEVLKGHNCTFSTPMTIDKIFVAREEDKISKSMYQFEDNTAIVAKVQHQMVVEHGNIVEINSDEEEPEDQPWAVPITYSKIIQFCKKLEMSCIS
ncbi:hypothetical protein PAXRUDRAFT_138602, partial [Paxillus rubicundulus Ve08.2h10]